MGFSSVGKRADRVLSMTAYCLQKAPDAQKTAIARCAYGVGLYTRELSYAPFAPPTTEMEGGEICRRRARPQ
jgi:hypothetical protein